MVFIESMLLTVFYYITVVPLVVHSTLVVVPGKVLPAGFAIVKFVWSVLVGWFGYWYQYYTFQHQLRLRRNRIICESSKRTKRVLDILDDAQLGDDELELIAKKQYIRCAVLLSRKARIGLKYPSYSKANEKIACDWISRHCPADMTMGVKHKVLPLAIKLTFVRNQHEMRAQQHFEWLGALVDNA